MLVAMTRIESPGPSPQDLDGVTAHAVSPDGMVEATVGAFGDLRELRLDPLHQRTRDTVALAATIMATVRAAGEAAARTAFAGVASHFPPGTRPEKADLLFVPLLHTLDEQIRRR